MIKIKKHLHFWKHNLIVYSPIWGIGILLSIFSSNPEAAGEIMGGAILMLIIMNLVFMFFKKEGQGSKGMKSGFLISVILGIVIISYSSGFNFLTSAIAVATFYLTKFIKFVPIKE